MIDKQLRNYKDLIVWQKAMDLVSDVYRVTANFPREEVYGLTNQLRRSAVSVPSNIAEGQGRAPKGEFIQFLCHSRGSLLELETQVLIASSLGYWNTQQQQVLQTNVTEVARMLNGLLSSLGAFRRKPRD